MGTPKQDEEQPPFTFLGAFQKAFQGVNGELMTVSTIDRYLRRLQLDNLKYLLPEFDIEWLFEYAEERRWFKYKKKKKKKSSGVRYKVNIPNE